MSGVESAAIASLNGIIAELVCGLAAGEEVTRGWAFEAVKTLAEHTQEIGFDPHITPETIAEWEGLDEDV